MENKGLQGLVFETAVNSIPNVVAVCLPSGIVQFLNKAAFKFLGTTPEQSIGKPLSDLCPAEIEQEVLAMLQKAVQQAAIQEAEVSGTLLDGDPYTSMLQAVPMMADGKVSLVFLLSHDITDRIEVERQREDHLERLDTLLKVSLDLLGVNDIQHLLDGVVAAAQRLTDARLAMASHLSRNGEWTLGPCYRAQGVMPCLPAKRFSEMRGGIYKELLTESSTLRLTDEQMRRHPMWWGLPPGHVPLRGFLATRIVNGDGTATGMISLSDKENGEFTAADETLIKHLGALASLALQHIEARDQVEKRATQAEEGQRELEAITNTLAKTATDLAQSNKDLEQFAYIASHDLQEPLRMITGFLQLLRDQYHGRFDQAADEYVAYAIDGAARMQRLVTDLLAYSRIGSQGATFSEINLDSVVDQVLALLSGPLAETGAVILRDPLPRVVADETQLVQLYQNLVGNSIKFRGQQELEIEIGARQENGQWLFWVRDNGIGFPQSQSDRAFMIFQRLHPREHYEGTGLGLAICKRVVERHRGQIWAESQPGHGATVYFTLNA
ncbi:MAG: ATP-binding protein [Candidatus Hydrogenedentes bacterium]|nr:ATP-binding protein [Candidatus Hydrogenedentota bacterium]